MTRVLELTRDIICLSVLSFREFPTPLIFECKPRLSSLSSMVAWPVPLAGITAPAASKVSKKGAPKSSILHPELHTPSSCPMGHYMKSWERMGGPMGDDVVRLQQWHHKKKKRIFIEHHISAKFHEFLDHYYVYSVYPSGDFIWE
ncbi:hypothetical protein EAF04_004783 [Stromatinia cepivora]|nr:hypothetical protein EAF04_004783 [Stromatinia cepivora]